MTIGNLMEQDSVEQPLPTTDELNRVAQMASVMTTLADDIVAAVEAMKVLKNKYRKVSEEDFPQLMGEIGLVGIDLADGRAIKIESFVASSLAKKNQLEAYEWCRSHGHGGLLKNVVTVTFGKGQDEAADTLSEELKGREELGQVALTESIHAMTLKSFVKEMITRGDEGELDEAEMLPEDLFGVYRGKKAIIK